MRASAQPYTCPCCRREWGRRRLRVTVNLAKNDSNDLAPEENRRDLAKPTRTHIVAGFDPRTTRSIDMERIFEKFGRVKVRISLV